ncbi:unnamed protein product [Ectocarpus sp. CCAP 1310/34]|nr:unnamed protein product [Ectocarpus sp. CCAP 1310/34]
MVRIINGEIVSDDDPRVAGPQRRAGGGGGGGGVQGRAGYGRVASLLDPPSTTEASGGGARGAAAGGRGAGASTGPLDKLAEMIGVQGRTVTIPGALGVQEQQVPFIYLMIAALVVLFGGWKVAAVIVFAYVIINQKPRGR